MKMIKHRLPGTGFITMILAFLFIKPILWIIFLFHGLVYLPHQKPLPREPLFLIGNHHSNWDGLYAVTYYIRHIPHFMVHDALFSHPVIGWMMSHLFGQINRRHVHQRLSSARELLDYAHQGHTVGLFPEGDIHMLGGSLPLDASVVKLIKKAGLPLVIFQIHGAYQRAPRWSDRPFKTRITIQTVEVLTREDIALCSNEQLYEKIQENLPVDAYETSPISVQTYARAERLERALYWCPSCHQLGSLHSHRHVLRCVRCEWKVTLSKTLTYENAQGKTIEGLRHPKDHDMQQREWLRQNIKKWQSVQGQGRLKVVDVSSRIADKSLEVKVGFFEEKLVFLGTNDVITIPIKQIQFLRLIHRTSWAFIVGNNEYYIDVLPNTLPGYFWLFAIDLHQRILYNTPEVHHEIHFS